ncbi:L-seryl-tRNA(Sec) selenium transferase, partial [Klebsiella pneumoniae]|nr:L-seryl-tRNA(Sec) selenium transferase [Klebsiella pneumoniae]
IDRLLRDPAFSSLLAPHGHSQGVTQLRQMLDEAREQIRPCQTLPDWSLDWLHACEQRLSAGQRIALRPVFNLSGTV